ncbi:aldehyde dehydrogenase (NADP(+)) [Pigmentiphaga litoralis]|uniref:2,5-dioxovalerate dehydrogenase n=1 Tax=Pigmentiphaga litoralis TaxID=516702 RepID=A0A7Y9IZ76_9BURK|nr:aldehyde dehydrogenase (NADP(+)) [Pigmentiphaga litoralis]NYE26787.1 NADP-dependent aldehyde dehydrogenase [Pigmentiphaga litoralis]NYE85803.1 NADP-dependent aldehyde dehydrogenase [Pigmentiphaga litoralis]
MTTITGDMLIGRTTVRGSTATLRAIQAATGEEIDPPFGGGGETEVQQACDLAAQAFDTYRETTPEARAAFLEAIATEIEAIGDTLIERAALESGLPTARLQGERGRTTGQLRLFAKLVRDGRWVNATLDTALPDRAPPRPDMRMRKIAVGPVAVFGASNFPLAFSVAGGDTASALAAGCPVVAKAHPGHLGTSELVGRAIQKAAIACDMPEGVFSLVVGAGIEIGQALVNHPAIKAVGFTGSRAGGLALCRTAAARPEPIPVYAEMSSINPMFLMPAALTARGGDIARGFIDSLTMGVGQFCTNPGLVIAVDSPALAQFKTAVTEAVTAKAAGTMLTPGIHQAYRHGVNELAAASGVSQIGMGVAANGPHDAQAAVFETTAATFLKSPQLQEEVFGPASLLVVCADDAEMRAVAEHVSGQLTATLQIDPADYAAAGALLRVLERKAGRVLVNGFPTGVEVSYAMVHGGPFPATSDSRTTSVGASAIERYLRPVCYQNLPQELLDASLKDGNPLGLWRLVDGELGRA